jgi:hypothetical protein
MLRNGAKGTCHPTSHTSKKLTTKSQIDYEKFKTVAGLSSAASARELMRVTKNKLKSEYGALGAGLQAANASTNSPAKTTPRKATPKKGVTPGSKRGQKAREEVDDDEESSPTKKLKVKEDGEGEGEGQVLE